MANDTARSFILGDLEEYPVAAAATINAGAALGKDGTGYARPLQAGDRFLGFAEHQADNAGGSAGDLRVTARLRGRVRLPVAGATVAANGGAAVYASDDDTFTLTAGTNSLMGFVSRWIGGTDCVVDFNVLVTWVYLDAVAAATP